MGGLVWKEGDEDKQPDRRRNHLLLNPLINVEAGRGERKREEKRGCVRWGGRGGGASVGEAEGCVLT